MQGTHIMVWNLVTWDSVPWSGSRFEMAALSQCSHFWPRSAKGAVVPERLVTVLLMCISQKYFCFLSEQSPRLCIISSTRLCMYHKHCASTKIMFSYKKHSTKSFLIGQGMFSTLSSRIYYSLHHWFHEPMLRTIPENDQGNCSTVLSRCKPYFVATKQLLLK